MLRALVAASEGALVDLHTDRAHHRSVFTLAGRPADVEAAARALAERAVALLDLTVHEGAHPRLGTLDVVPFVPLGPGGAPGPPPAAAVGARERFATWASGALGLPVFLYGPLPGGASRTLPEIRRNAFRGLEPDLGPRTPHPRAGAVAVGARGVLVAWNMWTTGADLPLARSVAASLRSEAVRSLAFDLPSGVQVSCNLVDPLRVGPAQVFDDAAALLEAHGAGIARCELVGLVPAAVLEAAPRHRWHELGLAPDRTLESHLVGAARA